MKMVFIIGTLIIMKMTPQTLFRADDRLADVVARCHRIILILPRFGMFLGFGDKSVQQVCQAYKVDTALFLEVCNMYAHPDYIPASVQTTEPYLTSLVNYLENSHLYYRNERLPHIAQHLHQLAAESDKLQGEMLEHFYSQYLEEVDRHFRYEETTVYPYARHLADGETGDYRIHDFEESHSDIEEKLADLTNIIIKYLPGEKLPQERTSILFDLFHLSSDLQAHTRIENCLLVAVARALEKSRKR